MKIYIASSASTPTQLCLDSASVLGADVVLIEKPGGITAAYPVSPSGLKDLKSTKLREHYQSEYNNSFFPVPFIMKNAVGFLFQRFEIEWVNNDSLLIEESKTFETGDLVICPSLYGNTVHLVVDTHQLSLKEKEFALHSQSVTIRDRQGYLPDLSGHLLRKVL